MPIFKGITKLGTLKAKELKPFEFEFEKFTLNRAIFKELILDEVLIYRSSKARKAYTEKQKEFPGGMLEQIYIRQDKAKKVNPEEKGGLKNQNAKK